MSVSSAATGPIHLLLVDDTPGAAEAVRSAVGGRHITVTHARDLDAAAGPLRTDQVDLVVLAVPPASPAGDRQIWLDVPVLAVIDESTQDAELRAMEEGALDWVARDELRPDCLPRAIRYVLDRHRLERELQRMAHVDPLTGLHNRRYLMKQLDAAVGAARRHGHPLTVCVCDIDRFKQVNDEHGHLAGDDVLRAFAGIVSQQLRREDAVARFGGDEFCLMFPHVTAEEAAQAVERIRQALEERTLLLPDGRELSVTATFGVAEFDPAEHRSGQALFDAADQALYEGKQRGRNRLSGVRD
ncbi:MAG TPA: GGDEF domain-containing response regulator [Egibacteraceae bacterium]|nr:GGDEF domain-containing response regulator [Egibacteraceae bacterium]